MKKALTGIMVVGSILALAGCGNKPTTRTIKVAVLEEKGEKALIDALISEYNAKNKGYKMERISFGTSETSYGFLSTFAMHPKDLPDIVWTCDTQHAGFSEGGPDAGGYFIDLRPFYESSPETSYDKYYEDMLVTTTVYGEMKSYAEDPDARYGMWYAPRDYNQPTLFCNKSLFEKFGVAFPDPSKETWNLDTFLDLLHTIDAKIALAAEDDRTAGVYRALSGTITSEEVYTPLMKAFGGDGITKDGHFNLDSEANKAALKKFDANFYNPDSQGGAQYKYVFTKGDDGFQNGTTFMTIAARPLIVKFADALEAQHCDMDFLPMPYEYNSAGNSGYGIISVHAEDEVICDDGSTIKVKDAAWDFIKFIITEEGQEIGSKLGSLVPVLKSLADTGSWKQYQADKNLHHEYFTSCDTIPLDQYNAFAPSKRLMLRQIVANDVFQVYTNPGKQSDRDEALVKARQLFEKEI